MSVEMLADSALRPGESARAWHLPTGSSGGRFEMLLGSVVAGRRRYLDDDLWRDFAQCLVVGRIHLLFVSRPNSW